MSKGRCGQTSYVHGVSEETLESRHMYLEHIERSIGRRRHQAARGTNPTAVSSTTVAPPKAPEQTEEGHGDNSSLHEVPNSLYDPPGSEASADYVSPAWTEDNDDLGSLVSSPSAALFRVLHFFVFAFQRLRRTRICASNTPEMKSSENYGHFWSHFMGLSKSHH